MEETSSRKSKVRKELCPRFLIDIVYKRQVGYIYYDNLAYLIKGSCRISSNIQTDTAERKGKKEEEMAYNALTHVSSTEPKPYALIVDIGFLQGCMGVG